MDGIRRRIAAQVFERVAGPEGPENRRRIHETPGERWFAEDSPIRVVHGDASMFVGGLRALLLQSLHPVAMAAVAAHSGYRGDPWGRLQRTSTFLATTTYATAEDAQAIVDKVRRIHTKVRGTTDEGVPYVAADPHLLTWVHIAEIDSFLRAHRQFGAHQLDEDGYDGYVADTAKIATALGVPDPPTTQKELADRLAEYRPLLRSTPAARDTAKFLLLTPPVPIPMRVPYAFLGATAVAMLPTWARKELGIPHVPGLSSRVGIFAGHGIVRTIRWFMTAPANG
ncbi:oxygenase MpaB family protein [Actinokineospora auranticolor]|uniref:Uncharacterized protein (DUF2236 family) n=1 Tax=Actinokineospora auranticolor TaxID=155976 RepID=A0A2S6H1D1_9PSEU|nr:oxygenase MpaB family protein [Actinokineospora auranticolor]PPK71273.1 uncharacterized protein (DUF2236 family) [Actinokineospora auranticolor]